MSENNSFKNLADKDLSAPPINSTKEISPKKIINPENISIPSVSSEQPGIMEVYENGIKIKGYKIREKNKDVNKLLME